MVPVVYRRQKDSAAPWHFHTHCSDWPEADYVQVRFFTPDESQRLCSECARLEDNMFGAQRQLFPSQDKSEVEKSDKAVMRLRDHPLMKYRGVPNWPPIWVESRSKNNSRVKGEIGTLKYVYSNPEFSTRCFLLIEHQNKAYVGTLLFSDKVFGKQVSVLLRRNLNKSIKEIGDIDVSQTL